MFLVVLAEQVVVLPVDKDEHVLGPASNPQFEDGEGFVYVSLRILSGVKNCSGLSVLEGLVGANRTDRFIH